MMNEKNVNGWGLHPASYHSLWGAKRRARNAHQIADLELKKKLADPAFKAQWLKDNMTTDNPAKR